MTPEQKIEKYYIERLNKYYHEVNDAITTILGQDFKTLLDAKKDFFYPVFTASKEGLEYHLGNTPEQEEKEIMEYLLEKIEDGAENVIKGENPAILINKPFPLEEDDEEYNEFLRGGIKKRSIYYRQDEIFASYSKIDIFTYGRDGLYLDLHYIWRLLEHLVNGYKEESFYFPDETFKIHCDIENSNIEIYLYILNTIIMQVVSLLRQKNIYLLDSPNDYDEERIIGKYKMVLPKFISAFGDLLPLFLLEPSKFIDIVGVDNFRDFTICTLNKNSGLNIDEIIERMLIERAKKASYEIVQIDLPLIARAKQKIEENKKKDIQESKKFKPLSTGFGSRIRDPKFDNLIFDNSKIINEINNLKIIDDKKYQNKTMNDDIEKYINPDDLPPRR